MHRENRDSPSCEANPWLAVFVIMILLALSYGYSNAQGQQPSQTATLTESGQVSGISASSTVTLTGQPITLTGIVEQERLDPACLTSVPPCGMPSRVIAILVSGPRIYALTSDDSALMEQLFSLTGSFVRVTGFLETFSLSGYNCSPYPCDRITGQVAVTSIAANLSNTLTTSKTSSGPSPQASELQLPSVEVMLVGFLVGLLILAIFRRARKPDH